MQHGRITEKLLAQLETAKPQVQAELARALGDRGDPAAVAKLLELAKQSSDSVRKAALQALALLADQRDLRGLVGLVREARTEAARAQAVETLATACQHTQAKHGQVDVTPLTEALALGTVQERAALLQVCGGLVDREVRAALRAALKDPDPQIRAAGIRALCDTRDPELLPDLAGLVHNAPEENFRTLAVSACVRLTTQEEGTKLSVPQRVGILKDLLSASLRADQKRLILAGLGELPVAASLEVVQPLLDDEAVKNEAAQAAIKIAPALPNAQASAATAALKKAIAATSDPASRQAAEAALKQIGAYSQFITAWQVSGPYVQEGKDYKKLFNNPFPPENKDATNVRWQALAPSTDPAKPWLMDLLKAFGGEERVAYARTWVYSAQEQPARLEIGSDDGLKVWFNDKMIHANNAVRGLSPGSDKMDLTLKAGWNSLLLKVTQFNQGWEFCARFLKPDGSAIEGLRYDAEYGVKGAR
jgi:HEAT repeat protein